MDQAQVQAAMHQAGLYYVTKGPGADSPKWTTVVSSTPAAGTMVKWHSTVTLNVNDK
jgi:beta-lactam-binding protein with PASTA domain